MKRIILFILFLIAAYVGYLLVTEETPTVSIEPMVEQDLPEPVSATVDMVRVDLTASPLAMYSTREDGSYFQSISTLRSNLEAEGKTLAFATNGGIFMENLTPLGLYVQDGKTLRDVNTVEDAYGNFYLQPNGIFYLSNQTGGVVPTEAFEELDHIDYATQSGPMLLVDGEINTNFNPTSENRQLRSGVCFPDPQTALFIISNEPVTFYKFAQTFLHEGCQDALYLDGKISTIYAPGMDRHWLGLEYAIIIGATDDSGLTFTKDSAMIPGS